ncbi:MAG: NAD(P)H-hydrate epimerase [Candidatus Omnitrophota bacterium]
MHEVILTSKQAHRLDVIAREKLGIPTMLLMENAGRAVADAVIGVLKRLKKKQVAILCGRGNNGGDGFVCARHLVTKGIKVDTYLLLPKEGVGGEAGINLNILCKISRVHEIKNSAVLKKLNLSRYGILVDAIFGTGLKREITGLYRDAILKINKSGACVLSIDIPSGLDATTGKVHGAAAKADLCVTFTAKKKGLLLNDGPKHSGKIIVRDLGVPII